MDYNVINDTIQRIAMGMAIAEDKRVWRAILGVTVYTDDAEANALASTNASDGSDPFVFTFEKKLLEVTKIYAGADWSSKSDVTSSVTKIDYYNGKVSIPGTSANDKAWLVCETTDREAVDATSAGILSYADLVAARDNVVKNKGRPDTIVVQSTADLLVDDKYIAATQASNAPSGPAVLTGEVNKVLNCSVLTSQEMYDVAVVLQKHAIGYKIYKQKLTTTTEKVPNTAGNVRVNVWEQSIPAIIRPKLITVVLNTQDKAASL